jgi:carotenoid cleavage dioxygenase
MVTTTVNPYFDGNFSPVRQEMTTEALKVIGELPPDLSEMFVRNGPNPQHSPISQYHWFNSDGMLRGVEINNGQATYHNRYVRTTGWNIEHETGKAVWSGILEPPQTDNP